MEKKEQEEKILYTVRGRRNDHGILGVLQQRIGGIYVRGRILGKPQRGMGKPKGI